ncbi:MAG TPA: HD domain-containing protein [Patescibacteria group bacterium]|nr:HD domain-containing protein [Patescibacteria group bacterium]
MKLPTLEQIEALHRKYAPSDAGFDLVFTHCNIVSEIAQQCILTKKLAVDAELVKVGCMLHDIGVYELLDKNGAERDDIPYITHGIRGEAILKKEGLPEVIWRFGSHHTGVGLTRQNIIAQNLPLPQQDYEAETIEEELVMYADKFHSKDTPPCFNTFEYYKRAVAKFGQDKSDKFAQLAEKFGVPDLKPLIEKYGHVVRN